MSFAAQPQGYADPGAPQNIPHRPWMTATSSEQIQQSAQHGYPNTQTQQPVWGSQTQPTYEYTQAQQQPTPVVSRSYSSQPIPIRPAGGDAMVVDEPVTKDYYNGTAQGFPASYQPSSSFLSSSYQSQPVQYTRAPEQPMAYGASYSHPIPTQQPPQSYQQPATIPVGSWTPQPVPPPGSYHENLRRASVVSAPYEPQQAPPPVTYVYPQTNGQAGPIPIAPHSQAAPPPPPQVSASYQQRHEYPLTPGAHQSEPVPVPVGSFRGPESYHNQSSIPSTGSVVYASSYKTEHGLSTYSSTHVPNAVPSQPMNYTTVCSPMPQPKIGFEPVAVAPAPPAPYQQPVVAAPQSEPIAIPQSRSSIAHSFDGRRQSAQYEVYPQPYGQAFTPAEGSYQYVNGSYQQQQPPQMIAPHGFPGQPTVVYPTPPHSQSPMPKQRRSMGHGHSPPITFAEHPAGMHMMSSSYMPQNSMPGYYGMDPELARLSTSAPSPYPGMSAAESALLRRREMHNLLERKRRSGLKECFQGLAEILPDLEKDDGTGAGPAKVTVLQLAVKRIRDLKDDLEKGQEVLVQVRADNTMLRQRLAELQQQNQKGDGQVMMEA